MTSREIQAALAAIVESVKQMGPERFRAEFDAQEAGDMALAFAEIEAFASDYLNLTSTPADVTASKTILDAIQLGLPFQQSFSLQELEQWIAANDESFALAA